MQEVGANQTQIPNQDTDSPDAQGYHTHLEIPVSHVVRDFFVDFH